MNQNKIPRLIVPARAKVSRRTLLAGAAAGGMIAATGLGTGRAHAQSIGGTLRVGTEAGSTDHTFDPAKTIGGQGILFCQYAVYDHLTVLGSDGGAAPQLATNWEVADDRRTWRFEIDPNAKFQNGNPVRPEDVIYSLDYATNEASTWAEGKSFFRNVESMSKDGNAVIIVQSSPDADLPIQLATWGFLIGPEGTTGEEWGQPGNGSGPYIIESYDPGVRAVLRRNPDHFRDDEGFFEAVEVISIADATTRTAAIRAGDLDIIARPDAATARMLDQLPGVNIVAAEGALHYTMPMRATADPFGDVNVRLAMKHLIDREAMLNTILNGYGYVGNDVPIGRNQQFYNPNLPPRAYDPEQAKFYLDKAGLSSLDLTLFASDGAFAGAVDAAGIVAESARAGGVNVTVNRVPADGYYSDVWNKEPWCMSFWSGRPTVGMMMESTYVSATKWNEAAWTNERFDELIAMAKIEADQDLRRDMYWEAQEILYNESSQLIPMFGAFLHAVSDKLEYPEMRGAYFLDNFLFARTASFKA